MLCKIYLKYTTRLLWYADNVLKGDQLTDGEQDTKHWKRSSCHPVWKHKSWIC